MMKNMYTKMLQFIILMFALTSCSAMDNGSYDVNTPQSVYPSEIAQDSSYPESKIATDNQSIDSSEDISITDGDVNVDNDRIEKYYQISTQTDNYDEDFNKLNSLMTKDNGYIESSNLSIIRDNNLNTLRNFYAVIKVPKDKSNDFLNEVQKIGKLDNLSNSSNNLNQVYTNVEIRLKSKKTELDKLNELMEKAQTLEDTMAIESRILEVQSEIDEIEAQIRDLNNRVTYDTFNISLIEVYKYGEYVSSNPNLLERLIEAFRNSIDIFINLVSEILVAFASLWPIILILLGLGYYFVRKNKKNKINKVDKE